MKQKIVSLTIALIATITKLQAQMGQPCTTCTTITNTNHTYSGGIFCNGGVNITINNGETLKLDRSTLQMTAGSKITVKNGGVLNLAICHIFGCSEMWQGIDVEPGGIVTTDGATVDNGNIIEDAFIAIKYKYGWPTVMLNTVYTGTPLLNLDNTVFNKNEIGIQMNGQEDGIAFPALDLANIFKIGNCIFTCRDIYFDASKVYDGGFGVKILKQTAVSLATVYPATPAVYTAPYIDYASYKDDVPDAFLKFPFSPNEAKSKIGIDLQNFASGTNGLYIGYTNGTQNNTKTTIFDNQDIGINAFFSGFTAHNCTFQLPNPHLNITNGNNAIGIYMNQNLFSSTAIVETVSGSPNNAFYDMRQAIKGDLMQNAIINSCDIQSNQDINPLMPMPYMPGDVGINLSLGTSKSIEVSNNNIYNVKLGILLYDDGSSGSYNDAVANINNNNIQATNPNIAAASPNNYVNWAIILTSSNNTLGYYNERVVNCNNNILHNVQNGIMLNNWQGTNTHADFNDIALALDPLAQGGDYYGIWMVSGIPMDDNLLDPMGLPKTSGYVGNTVTGNTVLGNSDHQQQIGIYTQAQYGTNYGCNTVNNLQHGIKFNDVCYSTVLWDNWMDKSNQYGFTLSQAIIGQQGTKAGKGTGACPSNNHWAGTNAQWLTNYSIPHYKTFNDNSYNVNSSFVVKSAPTEFNPNGCGTYNNPLGLFIFPYQHTSSTLSNTNTLLYAGTLQIDCGRCNGGASKMAPSTDETANIETLEQIADETIELPADNADQRLYSLQQQLYDIVKAKPALLLQSNELQSFAQANNWTVLDYIHYTGKYLAQNDANTADMLLSYWPQSTKQLDENYYQYYNWVTNMKLDKTYKPNLANVLALANKCPQKNGKVVYAARALYNGLTHSVHSFNNNCNAVASRQTITKKDKQATINTVSIYPNPSNGLIRIDLPSSNASESIKWYVTITDVYGKVVKQQHLTAKQTQLNMANAKGLYFTNVYNTITGKQTVTKIVLQ